MKRKSNTVANTHAGSTQAEEGRKFTRIKLGVDVHAESYSVVRQIDSATPQPAQKMTPEAFERFAKKQLSLAGEVHTCYEAGPFGYGLHRRLVEMGIRNVVVRPQNWDEFGRRVKTDKTDALALVQRLDRYVAGNAKALAIVRVPSEAEESERALCRHRQQLQKDRQAHEAQGRSLLLYAGHRVKGQWWRPQRWEALKRELKAWLIGPLENLRVLIRAADELLEKMTERIEAEARPQPKGFGPLTSEVLRREVLDWKRFKNRRQVASFTGMCPGVASSGGKSVAGSINKHGNPRVRRALVELSWRVVRFQPHYPPVVKWRKVLALKKARGPRKRAIVAIGRQLAVDLWRMATGVCTPQDLKLI
jgi:transposase